MVFLSMAGHGRGGIQRGLLDDLGGMTAVGTGRLKPRDARGTKWYGGVTWELDLYRSQQRLKRYPRKVVMVPGMMALMWVL